MTAALCPHNHGPSSGCGSCLHNDVIIQFIMMVPSSSYYTIRADQRFRCCNETMQVWHDERFFNWNQLWLWILFCILNVCVLCRWSSSNTTVWSPAPTWVWCSPACTSFIKMESRLFGWRSCSWESAAWSRPRLGSTTSPSQSPSSRCSSEYSSQLPSKWPERYHAVMISARAVRQYAHLPGSVSQFLHQLTYHEEGIFSIFTICEEGVFSRFPLIYSHFHSRLLTTSEKSKISSENFLQPPQGQQSKSCRRWTPPSAVRLPPYHEKASVSCAFCLNMTFLVNKGR